MSTRAEQLFAGVFTALQTGLAPLVASANVHRENTFTLDKDSELPAVTVHKGPDNRLGGNYRDSVRQLSVVVRIYAKGPTSEDADDIRQLVQQLMQTFFLASPLRPRSVEEADCLTDDAHLGGAAFEMSPTYEITYAQNEADL